MDYEFFMKKALEQAKDALARNEFPVGSVVVHKDEVIVTGSRNGTANGGKNEVDHAEMVALRRLDHLNPSADRSQMTLFCTMEPCLMCYGAILLSGIGTIVYAYEDVMGGGTACDLSVLPPLYRDRPITIVPDLLRRQSLELFREFFANPNNNYWQGSLLATYTLDQP